MSFDLKIENGDLVIGSDGDFARVENNEKLIQDILKLALTPINSNPFHPWYGSPVSRSIIGTAYDTRMISTIATNQLRTSLENYQKLQKNQAKEQLITPGEQLVALQEVKIERNIIDPRFFSVLIKVVAGTLNTVQTQFQINPGL